MKYPYSIKDISSKVKKTEQSLYTLIKKNQEFIKQNSLKQGRFIKYNQAVMDWFLDYYGIAQELPGQTNMFDTAQEPQETAQEAPQQAEGDTIEDLSVQTLKAKLEALEAENAGLRERLASSEAERRELQHQVGEALFALRLEKQEKMLLLPPPRKSIIERVKGFFSKPAPAPTPSTSDTTTTTDTTPTA